MFTGIIERIGRVLKSSDTSLSIELDAANLATGDSIAVNGVCLTVTNVFDGSFSAELSEETLKRSNLGSLLEGDRVNIERPVAAGAPLGGHIVQGHVDGIGRIAGISRLKGSVEMTIESPAALARYMVEKGSVAVDGVSLTVASVEGNQFTVALIPYTLEATNLESRGYGDPVNIEVDILAKYAERLMKPEQE